MYLEDTVVVLNCFFTVAPELFLLLFCTRYRTYPTTHRTPLAAWPPAAPKETKAPRAASHGGTHSEGQSSLFMLFLSRVAFRSRFHRFFTR